MVLHVEADVIEDAMACRRLRCVGLVETQLHARQINHRSVIARAGLAAERFHIPGLRFRNL